MTAIDASQQSTQRTDIAIIGIGCRLPGGVNSPGELWRLLVEQRDVIGQAPEGRWEPDAFDDPSLAAAGKSVPPWGGYLDDVAGFDADFFGVSNREAAVLDPQHRLLLEVGWEALDHAGLPADQLSATRTGIFTGLSYHDYMERLSGQPEELEGSILTNGSCVASGRFSYLLGLQGPSLSVDTACSSSLVAVHLACQSLRSGESTVALAGGVTLMLWPRVTKAMVRMGMLSPTGRCHAFDAAADGFVRSEGAGMVVLKRLDEAQRDGDRVLAVIRGSAVNQDGRTNGLVVPSADAQCAVAESALREAQVDPADVGLVEAHGTGTPVGDPVEFAALSRAYGAGTANCALGSVKTNLGHLEPAAGVTGLIKAVLCLQHGQIPANLHFEQWNPDLDAENSRFFVPDALTDWPSRAATRLAAVSSFGFSGTNAHVVLEQAPPVAEHSTAATAGPDAVVLPAGSVAALPAAANRLAEWLADSPDSVADVAYTLARRRSPGRGRLGVIASSRDELIRELKAFAGGRPSPNLVSGTAVAGLQRGTVWVFSGQGSQWAGMGRDLLDIEPAFTAALADVDPMITAEAGFSVLDALRNGEEVTGCARVQPMIFAMQIALAAMWRAHGVEPAGVIGHSMGEVAAAVVAGALTLADGVAVICRRSNLLTRIAGAGAMATVALDRQALEKELATAGATDEVSIAVLAAPGATVIAGATATVEKLLAEWDGRGIVTHPIAVDVASHSPQVDPLLPDLRAALAQLRPSQANVPFYSTVLDDVRASPRFDADYWSANLRRTVRFADAVTAAASDGHRVFIEIAPHPVVSRSITDLLGGGPRRPTVLPTLRREEDGRSVFRTQLAAAHCIGVPVDWSVLYPAGSLVDVPGLTFDRQRHWIDISAPAASAPTAAQHGATRAPLPGSHLEIPGDSVAHSWQADAGIVTVPWLADHRVHDLAVLPGAAFCALALAAAGTTFDGDVEVSDIAFEELLHLEEHTDLAMTVTAHGTDRGRCEIYARNADGWSRHAVADVHPARTTIADTAIPLATLAAQHPRRADPAGLYRSLRARGIDHGAAFTAVTDLHLSGDGASVWSAITIPALAAAGSQGLPVHPVLLDACAQSLMACLSAVLDDSTGTGLILPVGIDRLRLLADPDTVRYCHGRLEKTDTGSLVGHARLLDADGRLVALIDGLHLLHHAAEPHLSSAEPQTSVSDNWLYGLEWLPEPRPEPESALPGRGTRWLLLRENLDQAGVVESVEAISGALRAAGADLTLGTLPEPDESTFAWAQTLEQKADGHHAAEHIAVLLDGHLDLEDPAGDSTPLAAQRRTQSLLTMVRALTELPGNPPRLHVVTRGAQDLFGNGGPNLQLGGVRGLLRVIALEHPEFRTVHVDADAGDRIGRDAQDIVDELLSDGSDDEVAFRSGLRFVARVTPAPVTTQERHKRHHQPVRYGRDSFALGAPASGNLDDLRLIANDRRPPSHGQVEIKVQAAGMNFRDVLISLGVLPTGPIGFECAGVVTAVGPGVTAPRVGDQVLAADLTSGGAFGSFLTTAADLTMPIPAGIDPTTAAGIPAVFVTAWYALKDVARLRAGERILIHSGTGGTGMAAISIARFLGAEVLATAGTAEKRAYLRGMGIRHVMDSRSIEFAAETLAATDGQGVDVVLNALSGPAIRAGLECLRPFGRFVELGLRDILADTPLGLLPFRNSVTFASVNLIELYRNQPQRVAEIFEELTAAFASKELTPAQVQTYPLEDATEAFRFMASGTHIGKIVLTVPDDGQTSAYLPAGAPVPVHATGSYLITGGLGGIGLETAAWLARHHAGRVILNGRSAPVPTASRRLAEMAASGTDIQVVLGDIAEPGVAQRLVAACEADGFRLAGVLHAAMVLEDAALVNTTPDMFDRVWRPKVLGAWRLHEATEALKLDWFVLFSSMSSLLGNPGQSAYAAANSWLDNFSHWRRARGLRTTAVNWGPWGEVGAATDFSERGYDTIGVQDGMHALETLLVHDRHRAAVIPGAPATWIPAAGRSASLFNNLSGQLDAISDQSGGADERPTDIRGQLQATPAGLPRRAAFEEYLTSHLSAVMRLEYSSLDPDTPLRSLGFDSLLALELRSRLEPGLNIKLPGNFIWKYPTLATLAAGLADYANLALDDERPTETAESIPA